MSESIDTTSAMGEFVFTLLAGLSQLEREQARERTRAALAYKRTRHEKTGGDVPFGYSCRAGKLVPKAKELAVVADIIERHGRGESLRAICAALEAAGVRRKNGAAKWHPEAVRLIIRPRRLRLPVKHRAKVDRPALAPAGRAATYTNIPALGPRIAAGRVLAGKKGHS